MKQRWLRQIDRLRLLAGSDHRLLDEVQCVVKDGFKLDFPRGPPPPAQYKNTFTFRQHEADCLERLRVYEDLGALRWLSNPPPPGGYEYVQPLHAVVKPGKKARVCVDMGRNLNDYASEEAFQYSSVAAGVRLAQECPGNAWFVKLDLSACFLSFPLHPDDYKYYVCEAGGNFLQFTRMVFGLKNAPRVVSLLLDVVSSALTDAGVAHVRYLDDFFLVTTTEERAWACAHKAAGILLEFGLALSPDKVEGPAQRLEFLGIVFDSLAETLSISRGRRDELLGLLRRFSGLRDSTVKALQSLLGKLSFASTVLPGARPFLRRIIDMIRGGAGKRRLSTSFRADIDYWAGHIDQWNGTARWRRDTSDPFVFGSDASTSGWAFGLEQVPARARRALPADKVPGSVRAGIWSGRRGDAGRQQHSSAIQYGEFFCVLAAATEYGSLLRDSHVVFMVDNASDVFVINRLSTRDSQVARLLRALCDQSVQHNFSFSAVWRAGEANDLFDWASRPEKHLFAGDPAAFAVAPAHARALAQHACGGLSPHPPLLHAHSLSYVNSRCLSFGSKGNSASWCKESSGW